MLGHFTLQTCIELFQKLASAVRSLTAESAFFLLVILLNHITAYQQFQSDTGKISSFTPSHPRTRIRSQEPVTAGVGGGKGDIETKTRLLKCLFWLGHDNRELSYKWFLTSTKVPGMVTWYILTSSSESPCGDLLPGYARSVVGGVLSSSSLTKP